MIGILLLLLVWLSWRGARAGAMRAGLHLLIVGAAWPIGLLLRPLFARLVMPGGLGPLAVEARTWFGWLFAVALLDLLLWIVRRHRRGRPARVAAAAVPARGADRIAGGIVGAIEAVILAALIARGAQIAARIAAWPELYPQTVRIERPGLLRAAGALGRGWLAGLLGRLVGPVGGGLESDLDRAELLLELGELPDGPADWAKRSATFRSLAERPEIAALLGNGALQERLERGETEEVWADPRVRALWADPAIWEELAAALNELRTAPPMPAGRR